MIVRLTVGDYCIFYQACASYEILVCLFGEKIINLVTETPCTTQQYPFFSAEQLNLTYSGSDRLILMTAASLV